MIHQLEGEGSVTSSIYRELHLTRSVVKTPFTNLQSDRRRQVVFASIACATRFKIFSNNGPLRPTTCAKCGKQDSLGHLLECSRLGPVPREGTVDQLLDFLRTLVREVARYAPVVPTPYTLPEADEISFDGDPSDDAGDDEEMDTADSLSFERPESNLEEEPVCDDEVDADLIAP